MLQSLYKRNHLYHQQSPFILLNNLPTRVLLPPKYRFQTHFPPFLTRKCDNWRKFHALPASPIPELILDSSLILC